VWSPFLRFGAANASATTWFECRPVTPEKTGTWLNQKCTEMSATNTGEFQWIENTQGKQTKRKYFRKKPSTSG
jgi:hypothetical protein